MMKNIRIYVDENSLSNWNISYRDIVIKMCEDEKFEHKDIVGTKSFVTVKSDTLDDMYCDLDEESIRVYLLYKITKFKNVDGKTILSNLGLPHDKYNDMLDAKNKLATFEFIKSEKVDKGNGRVAIKHHGIVKK